MTQCAEHFFFFFLQWKSLWQLTKYCFNFTVFYRLLWVSTFSSVKNTVESGAVFENISLNGSYMKKEGRPPAQLLMLVLEFTVGFYASRT